MRRLEALAAALAMVRFPHLVRLAQRAALPAGMTLLLEVAAGDADALALAKTRLGRSETSLRRAAALFVEQVLLDSRNDSYRTLGESEGAPRSQLRRHMALLLQALHPDKTPRPLRGLPLDRNTAARRITEAWNALGPTLGSDHRLDAVNGVHKARDRSRTNTAALQPQFSEAFGAWRRPISSKKPARKRAMHFGAPRGSKL